MTTSLDVTAAMAGMVDRADDRLCVLVPNKAAHPFVRTDLARDPAKVPVDIANAFRYCREGKLPWPLLIVGPAGRGKSRFGLLVSDWYGGMFTEFAAVVDEYRLCKCGELHDERYENRPIVREPQYRRMMREHRIVVVDDIGQREDSDHARETLMMILNERTGPHPTVLISNLSVKELASVYDDRVSSRMAEGTVVGVKGIDIRLSRTEVFGAKAAVRA